MIERISFIDEFKNKKQLQIGYNVSIFPVTQINDQGDMRVDYLPGTIVELSGWQMIIGIVLKVMKVKAFLAIPPLI